MSNRWGNNGNGDRLYLLGSEITADGDYSHAIKRRLLLGRKAMTNLVVLVAQSCVDVRVGPQRKLSTKELMLLNIGIGEDS